MWCVLTGEFWPGQSNRSWNNLAIKVGCWPCDFSMKSRQFLLPLCYFCKLTGKGKMTRVNIWSVSEIEGTTNAFYNLRAWGNGPKIYNSPFFWYSSSGLEPKDISHKFASDSDASGAETILWKKHGEFLYIVQDLTWQNVPLWILSQKCLSYLLVLYLGWPWISHMGNIRPCWKYLATCLTLPGHLRISNI